MYNFGNHPLYQEAKSRKVQLKSLPISQYFSYLLVRKPPIIFSLDYIIFSCTCQLRVCTWIIPDRSGFVFFFKLLFFLILNNGLCGESSSSTSSWTSTSSSDNICHHHHHMSFKLEILKMFTPFSCNT